MQLNPFNTSVSKKLENIVAPRKGISIDFLSPKQYQKSV
jgi:hypothetical protein